MGVCCPGTPKHVGVPSGFPLKPPTTETLKKNAPMVREGIRSMHGTWHPSGPEAQKAAGRMKGLLQTKHRITSQRKGQVSSNSLQRHQGSSTLNVNCKQASKQASMQASQQAIRPPSQHARAHSHTQIHTHTKKKGKKRKNTF